MIGGMRFVYCCVLDGALQKQKLSKPNLPRQLRGSCFPFFGGKSGKHGKITFCFSFCICWVVFGEVLGTVFGVVLVWGYL